LISIFIFYTYYKLSFQYFLFLFVAVIGLIIWWAGKLALKDSFSALPKAKKLVNTGIYSKISHPIYLGLSLTMISWSFLINSVILGILTIIVIISCILRAKLENKVLRKKFGKKYLNYKNKTWF
jgi:protein-S-isoprenylcysteine O-methyltransferase Ste14